MKKLLLLFLLVISSYSFSQENILVLNKIQEEKFILDGEIDFALPSKKINIGWRDVEFRQKVSFTSARFYHVHRYALKDDGNPYDFVAVDSDGLIALEFGVFGLPETFLVNENGKIIYKYMGPLTKKIIEDEIEPLL